MITSGLGGTASDQEVPSPSNRQIERVLGIRAYLQLAWQLSKTSEDVDDQRKQEEYQVLLNNIAGLQTETRQALEVLANILKSDAFKEESSKVSVAGHDLIFLEQDSAVHGSSKEQKAFDFLKAHPSIKKGLFSEEKIDAFESSQKRFARNSRIANAISGILNIFEQSAYDKYHIFPPFLLAVIFVVGSAMFAAPFAKYWAGKEDLNFDHKKETKKKSVIRIILAICAFITFILAYAVGGPAVIGSIAAFMTLYGFVRGFINIFSGFKSALEFFKERKKLAGESEETYRYRRTKKGMQCIKYFSDAVFCLGVSVVWGLGFAAVANPIGLKIVAVLSIATAVATACFGVAQTVEMFTSHKIKQATDGLSAFDRVHLMVHKHADTLENNLHAAKNKVPSFYRSVQNDSAIHVDRVSALLLLRDAQSQLKKVFMKPLKKINDKQYFKFHQMSIKQLERLQKKGSIYDDVSIKSTSNHQPVLPERIESPALFVVEVPRTRDEEPGVYGPDYRKKDTLTRHRDGEDVRMGLNADASDRALYLFFQLNRGFGTLTMDFCGKPALVLKVMEAAKLMNVEVALHTEDYEFFEKLDPDNEMKIHFNALKAMSIKEFQKLFKKKEKAGDSVVLGTVLREPLSPEMRQNMGRRN